MRVLKKNQAGSALLDLVLGVMITMQLLLFVAQAAVQIQAGRNAHKQGQRLAAGAAALQSLLNTYGTTIASSGTAPGFTNALAPSATNLRDAGMLPRYVPTSMPFGGNMTFVIRKGTKNELLGFACGDKNITLSSKPSPSLAGRVMSSAGGSGLRTSIATPTMLNGLTYQNLTSPITGEAIVCASAFLSAP